MLSENDAALDLCLTQWAEDSAGELRSALLAARSRLRELAPRNERGDEALAVPELRERVERYEKALEWYAGSPEADEWRIIDKDGVVLIHFGFIGDRARKVLGRARSELEAGHG